MAKQKFSMTQQDPEPIEEFNEWQEHQYNTGYWVNRFPKGYFSRKRSKGAFRMNLLILSIYLAMFFVAFYVYLLFDRPPGLPALIIFLGAINILYIYFAFRAKPIPTEPKADEQDENASKNKRKKKRGLPKRPKNYR